MNVPVYTKASKRQRRWIHVLGLAFLIYTLAGFFLLPQIIKWQLEKQLPSITKRSVKVRQVRVNPWVLSLTIRGLSLQEPDATVFASWEEFYVNFQLSSLFRLAWTFKEIRLDRPYGDVILRKDGTFNFANLFPPPTPEASKPVAAPPKVPRLNVFLLSITNGFLELEDQTRRAPFKTEYRPINIRLTGLATRPGATTPYSFRAENDTGEMLSWAGDITAQPFGSRGTIGVQGADPKKYQPYLDDFTFAQITDGKGSLQMDYFVSTGTNGVDLVVSNATVRIDNLKIADPATNEVVFAMPSLSIDGGSLNLRQHTAGIRNFRIRDVSLSARRNADSSINLANLLRPPPPAKAGETNAAPTPASPSALWLITVDQFALENASADFSDLRPRSTFKTRLSPISVIAKDVSTRTNHEGTVAVSIKTESEETVNVDLDLSLKPPGATGQLRLGAIELKKYLPYGEDLVRATIESGKCDIELGFRAALDGTNLLAGVSNGVVKLSDLRLRPAGTNETVVQIPELTVEGAEASLENRTAAIGTVRTSGGTILGRRLADGTINLLQLVATGKRAGTAAEAPAAPPASGLSPAAPPWSARLGQLDLTQYQVTIEDCVPATPVTTRLKDLAIRVEGASTSSNVPVNVKVSLGVNDAGQVTLAGTGLIAPPSARAEIAVTNLDLAPFQAYIQDQVQLGVSSALLGVRGTVAFTPQATDQKLSFEGEVGLRKFVTTDRVTFREFVKWEDLRLQGLDLRLEPNRVAIKDVSWNGLDTSLIIQSNKQPNVASVLAPRKSAGAKSDAASVAPPPPAAGSSAGPLPFPVTVESFTLKSATFHFTDESIQPFCRFDIQKLDGTIKGLSSDARSKAEVDFKGLFDEQSPFWLGGTISPLAATPSFSLTFSNRSLQLPFLTPYTEKFAGHPLNRGRLSMNLRYDVEQSKLTSDNKFRVDQLTLGPRNDSPDATKLPVKLGVALLKDADGKIELDVPVTGTLGDPEFRVGRIIGKVIVNMITKAATSPFKLLGSLVGAGEELAFMDFEPGTAAFAEGETNKIEKLSQALAQRPALSLEIEAQADPRLDREALARGLVREELRVARLRELEQGGQKPANVETFELDPATYDRLLRAALIQQFGTNLDQALGQFVAAITNSPAIPVTTREPAKKPGLFARLESYLPFAGRDNPIAQERRRAKADSRLLKENPRLAEVNAASMEGLLASKREVPEEKFRELMQARAKQVQAAFLGTGLDPERLFLVAPKPLENLPNGQARVNLSLN